MNRPKFTCETAQEFAELEGYFNKFAPSLQKQIEHLTFQKKPFKHFVKIKDSYDERVAVFLPIHPSDLISVKTGYSVEYDNLIFTGNLKENQSVEFHFQLT